MLHERTHTVLVAVSLVAGPAAAQDWPQWRGPGRDGHVPRQVTLSWPKALEAGWKVSVGIGYSSPVVAGQRVFTFARNGENEVAASFDLATGKLLWTQSYRPPTA